MRRIISVVAVAAMALSGLAAMAAAEEPAGRRARSTFPSSATC